MAFCVAALSVPAHASPVKRQLRSSLLKDWALASQTAASRIDFSQAALLVYGA